MNSTQSQDSFEQRHIGFDHVDEGKILAEVGYSTASELLEAAVPDAIQINEALNTPGPLAETQALAALRELSNRNDVYESLIGQGWNDCITPAVLRRNMLESPAWYTSYTPYQPEISQGRLEMLLTFQTMIADLTGCEIANASMLDEATASAEAMTMLRRISKSDKPGFFIHNDCHPQTVEVVATRAEPLGITIVRGSLDELEAAVSNTKTPLFGALLAQPGTSGEVHDLSGHITALHEADALVAVSTDLYACCLITPPGEIGADVVVGSAQRFGVPMGFGGPHAGFMATAQKFARSLPGRLVGVSKDSNGNPAYRLSLQAREQHIRREKATSNICTAQALLANVAAAFAAWHGPEGLTAIAKQIHGLAAEFAKGVSGISETSANFFDTVTVAGENKANDWVNAAVGQKMNLCKVDENTVRVSFDETSTLATVNKLLGVFGVAEQVESAGGDTIFDPQLRRTSNFLSHPNFNRYQTEHEMLRWLRRLSDRDLALDRTMIPLGSCTMKLNAAAEMEPISWPAFAGVHPFAPLDQTKGYQEMISQLETALCEITGYHAISLQPNAGSQGEYAGLLAIRGWHQSNGETNRDVCLIPASAHGTNAASAVMAGMRVVVVACDEAGNVDMADLDTKISEHSENLAALMITYPSTHGVYEETVGQVCDKVHAAGGQVYTDGANLNALVGVAKPGKFGSDVSHLNLHKTFCIPHGGGGPGVGPVGVAEHLAPFLPSHPMVPGLSGNGEASVGPVSAAPWGSAGILPISWMYVQMMGPNGLRRATETAVLAANYVARRIGEHYPVLYKGNNDLVAHECIVDLRDITAETGVTNDDVAKRLADYGFHAPTMSFPVPGTLMIEPTESESLVELDRFCNAMISIKDEINEIASGKIAVEDSVLRHAPHTAKVLLEDDWQRSYPRSQAAFPLPNMTEGKIFCPRRANR